MAIGYTSGYMKKKVGDKVLFTNQNVKGAVKQVTRAYQGRVAQPLTRPRSEHRALFTAAANFRRSFASILDHSWQGQKYGISSLAHFIGIVTAHHGDNYPNYLLQGKDIRKNIPQEWPVSSGSLINSIHLQRVRWSNEAIFTTLETPSYISNKSLGELWTVILENTPNIHEGDKLTFLAFAYEVKQYTDINEVTFVPLVDSITVDTKDERRMCSVNGQVTHTSSDVCMITDKGLFRLNAQSTAGKLFWRVNKLGDGSWQLGGCACIQSRQINGKRFMRSNSIMLVSDYIKSIWNRETNNDLAIRSWLDPEFLSSDWYLNQLK